MTDYRATLIFFILGITFYIFSRKFFPWPNKYQKFFLIISFGGLLIGSFFPIPSEINNKAIIPFFAGLIISDFFKVKILNIFKKIGSMSQPPPPNKTNGRERKNQQPTKKRP